MDIGAAQDLFGVAGKLSRIDLQLRRHRPANLCTNPAPAARLARQHPAGRAGRCGGAHQQPLARLPRQPHGAGAGGVVHRAFLVFSVLALGVAQRAPPVCAAGRAGRHAAPAPGPGAAGGGCARAGGQCGGHCLGALLAQAALHLLGGDLGAVILLACKPACAGAGGRRLLYAALGLAAALAGGWWPARTAQAPPAATLKGLGLVASTAGKSSIGLVLVATGVLLASAPPVGVSRWLPTGPLGCCWWAAWRLLPRRHGLAAAMVAAAGGAPGAAAAGAGARTPHARWRRNCRGRGGG